MDHYDPALTTGIIMMQPSETLARTHTCMSAQTLYEMQQSFLNRMVAAATSRLRSKKPRCTKQPLHQIMAYSASLLLLLVYKTPPGSFRGQWMSYSLLAKANFLLFTATTLWFQDAKEKQKSSTDGTHPSAGR